MSGQGSDGLSEFLCFAGDTEELYFTRDRTLALIALYQKYKPKIGSSEIKNMRRMWEVIARDLSNQFKITVLPTKCENRWKVLERNYKKFIDNNNKTGRGAKFFEFEKEFDDIYGRKASIKPSFLLTSNSVLIPDRASTPQSEPAAGTSHEAEQNIVMLSIEDSSVGKENKNTEHSTMKRKRSVRTTTSSYKKRNDILLDMKNDLKKYYEEKSKRDEEKLDVSRKKYEDRVRRTNLIGQFLKQKD
ncbi:unnamed protein product [Phaedon cochleariae]|uniref:Myb/SANT-like DNA-binding domain-containing protein n=1 Tax=Phaedon cochleariae TaxID=80249 RepID=A0A9N9WZS9_PHACE|nr:unnamed protein product [Phaedon cochleariae]